MGIVGTYDLDNLNKSGLPNDFSFGSIGGGVWKNFTLTVTYTFGERK